MRQNVRNLHNLCFNDNKKFIFTDRLSFKIFHIPKVPRVKTFCTIIYVIVVCNNAIVYKMSHFLLMQEYSYPYIIMYKILINSYLYRTLYFLF